MKKTTIVNSQNKAKQIMRVIEARRLFIESYIQFEHEVRLFARKYIDLYMTKNKSLNRIIKDLGRVTAYKKDNIEIRLLKKHKNCRNWLVHQNANSIVSAKQKATFKEIQSVLKQIKSWRK